MAKKVEIALGVLVLAGLSILVLGVERGSAPWVVLFVGRFHPTVVHFPIALLILAILIEVLSSRSDRIAGARAAVPFILFLGALSALVAVVLGYLLSLAGGYDDELLSLHMWLGLGATLVAFGLVLASTRRSTPGRLFRVSLFVLGALVLLAGHLGGTLARGSGYLTYYLPQPVRQLIGLGSSPGSGLIADVDSALVFGDLIHPILERRCTKCHGAGKSEGGLRLDSQEGVEEGGRDGIVLVAGNPSQSEILRRITLPSYDEDSMPPDGEPPLDIGETELIRWWIQNGASFDVKVAEIREVPSAVETYLARVAAPRESMRTGIYALDIPPADTTLVGEIRDAGIAVTHMAADSPFLLVSASGLRDRFTDGELEMLVGSIAPQVARLDLGNTSVTSDGAALLANMPHLTHIHVENTSVGDDALIHLENLEYLEFLNLYGTSVSDEGLESLSRIPSLRSVYLWRTRATEDGVERLRRAIPGVDVNLGAELASVETDTVSAQVR